MKAPLVSGAGQLFGREYELQIYSGPQATSDVRLTDKYQALVYKNSDSGERNLRIQFAVEQKHIGIDDGARIQIFNMSAASRAKLFFQAQVRLYAGYPDNRGLIFAGSIMQFVTKRAGPDNVTTLTCSGAALSIENYFFNKSYKTLTTLAQIVNDIQKSTHVRISSRGEGTVVRLARTQFVGLPERTFANGIAFHGTISDALDKILPSGYTHRIDAEELIITGPDALTRVAAIVSFKTGLIGTPSTTYVNTAVAIQFSNLLNPRLRVGAFCLVYSPLRKDPYQCRITAIKIQGDTHDGPWQVDCVAETLTDIRTAEPTTASISADNFADSGDAEGAGDDDGGDV